MKDERRIEQSGQKRSPMNLRTSAALRARIEAAAGANGLSLTQEVERTLMRAYDGADALGGDRTAAFLRLLAAVIRMAELNTGLGWHEDEATWRRVRDLVSSAVDAHRPVAVDDSEVEAEEGRGHAVLPIRGVERVRGSRSRRGAAGTAGIAVAMEAIVRIGREDREDA